MSLKDTRNREVVPIYKGDNESHLWRRDGEKYRGFATGWGFLPSIEIKMTSSLLTRMTSWKKG